MPKFIKPFRGVPAGEIYPRAFEVGEECPEELEEGAKELSALEGFDKKPSKGKE